MDDDPPIKGVPELVVWLAALAFVACYVAPLIGDWGRHDSYASPVADARDEGSGIGAWIDSWVEW